MVSCQKQELKPVTAINSDVQVSSVARGGEVPFVDGAKTVLGAQKLNPYTLTNMKTAWDNLAKKGILTTTMGTVRTTHYYVKFKPKNSDQYEALHFDSAFSLSDLPIESTVITNGDYYHDPSLPDSVPTFQYTAVRAGYPLPDSIPYEIIEALYIPEKDQNFNYDNGGTNDLFVDQLLNQAYTQTRNYEDTIPLGNAAQVSARRYYPGGRIQVFDTRLQTFIGMEGERVEARRWFEAYSAYPDFNGNYRMPGRYKRPCNYSIWFVQDRFSVRHNVFNTTFWINGPKISGDWNYNLNDSYQRFVGHIFRGGYRYHYKNIGGLQRPYRWFGNRTLYIAKDAVSDGQGINYIVTPVLKVWRYSQVGNEYNSDEIFSTTCHETGHTSHVIKMNAGPIQYVQVSQQLQESWAVAIEWFITNIEYVERGIANYGDNTFATAVSFPNQFGYQFWNLQFSSQYTPLFIDLIDNHNQFNIFYGNYTLPGAVNDQVNGYTISLIEDRIIKHSYGLTSLGNKLKENLPVGVTNAQIDLLLSSY